MAEIGLIRVLTYVYICSSHDLKFWSIHKIALIGLMSWESVQVFSKQINKSLSWQCRRGMCVNRTKSSLSSQVVVTHIGLRGYKNLYLA